MKLFQRAVQYTDPKKLHLAALSMFERSGRGAAADQLVKAVLRKFGGSAKVRACMRASDSACMSGTSIDFAAFRPSMTNLQAECTPAFILGYAYLLGKSVTALS